MTAEQDDGLPIGEGPTAPAAATGRTQQFDCLDAFVATYLSPMLARKDTPRRTWCPRWWVHPEAVLRLWALWQAWELFYAEGGAGPSSWFVYHLDHHLALLFDPEVGPFAFCRDGHSDAAQPLPCEPAPAGAGPIIVGERPDPQAAPSSGAGEPGRP